jgi:hypothetical protein
VENINEESGAARLSVSRSPALCYHPASGGWHIGLNHHGDCGSRQQTDAGEVQPRSDGSEAQCDGSPCHKHQNGGL